MQMQPENKPQLQELALNVNHIVSNSNILSQSEQPWACKVQLVWGFGVFFKIRMPLRMGAPYQACLPYIQNSNFLQPELWNTF